MNEIRRKQLKKVIEQIESIVGDFECIQNEEEDCFDNIPENLRGTERYEKAGLVCDYLYDAYVDLENAICNIQEAIE